MDNNVFIDRIKGCLYGQAIGDALGLGAEFMTKAEVLKYYPNGLKYYDQIIQDSHRGRWEKGMWTDDTDMMLCVLNGVENGKFNTHTVAQNFKEWFNGTPMGIGRHTFNVLFMGDYVENPEMCAKVWWDLSRHKSAANGGLMRTSIVGLVQNHVEEQAEAICKLTHYDPRCVASCVVVSSIIHNLVWWNRMLSYDEIIECGMRYDERICEWIDIAFNSNNISMLGLDEESSMGYTFRTLSAGLWCYWHAHSFEEGLLDVVNAGGDADTNGAVACAILGAKLGYSAIPAHYINNLYKRGYYEEKCNMFISSVISYLENDG